MLEKLIENKVLDYFDLVLTVRKKDDIYTVMVKPKIKVESTMIFGEIIVSAPKNEIVEKVNSAIESNITNDVINTSIDETNYTKDVLAKAEKLKKEREKKKESTKSSPKNKKDQESSLFAQASTETKTEEIKEEKPKEAIVTEKSDITTESVKVEEESKPEPVETPKEEPKEEKKEENVDGISEDDKPLF